MRSELSALLEMLPGLNGDLGDGGRGRRSRRLGSGASPNRSHRPSHEAEAASKKTA